MDFDRFSDIDELYVSLPLDKVEALEDMVTLGTSGLVKVTIPFFLDAFFPYLFGSLLVSCEFPFGHYIVQFL